MSTNKYNYLSSDPVSLEQTEIIVNQIKSSICQIIINEKMKAIGAFCKVPFPDEKNLLPIILTSNIVLDRRYLENEDEITILIYNCSKPITINLENRIKYSNDEYDIAIIEIKEDIDGINNYLEIDDLQTQETKKYIKKSIYILQFFCENFYISYGIIDNIIKGKEYSFNLICSTIKGSIGSLILNFSNNKLIGINIDNKDNKYDTRGNFLGFAFKEFVDEKYYHKVMIKEFLRKYNLKLIDNKIESMDLSYNDLGNDDFKFLKDLDFKELDHLKDLNLEYNNIQYISSLNEIKFKEIENLNLSNNRISNISVFENVIFKGLKILNLSNNYIININCIMNFDSKLLEVLDLIQNLISNIQPLTKAKFDNLTTIKFSSNSLSTVKFQEICVFTYLKEFDVSKNKINQLESNDKINLENLEILDISHNYIQKIDALANICLISLKKLYLNNNQISDIYPLKKINLDNLEILDLSNNNISSVRFFEGSNYSNLKILNLAKLELLSDINSLGKANIKELKSLNISNTKIGIADLKKLKIDTLEILNVFHIKKYNLKDVLILIDISLMQQLFYILIL